MNFESIRKNKYILIHCFYLFFTLLCVFLSMFSKGVQLDSFLSKVNSPNQHNYYNGFVSPYLKLKKNSFDSLPRYSNLSSYFAKDSFVNGCRETIDHDTRIDFEDEEMPIKFVTQNTFRIEDKKNSYDLFTVDQGMFYSYVSPSDVSDVMINNHQIRNGCDTFGYISDTLAEKLIERYGLSNSDTPYLDLIKNDEYSTLEINVDDNKKALKICINSVLSSKHRFATQIQNIYGDFILIYMRGQIQKYINSLSFDVDFKVNQYGNRRTLETLNTLGYSVENSTFEFHSYDYKSLQYFHDANLDKDYLWINTSHFLPEFVPYLSLFFGVIIVLLLSLVKKSFKNKADVPLFFANGIAFLIYGIICNFINVAPFYSAFPILCLITIGILNWKEVFRVEKYIVNVSDCFEISI